VNVHEPLVERLSDSRYSRASSGEFVSIGSPIGSPGNLQGQPRRVRRQAVIPQRLKHEWGLGPLRVRRLPCVRLHVDLTILARLTSALTKARAVPLAA
jgi:hypothetical protein